MMEELTIQSTRNQLEEFKESLIWADIKAELLSLLERATLEYDLVGERYVDDSGYKVTPTSSETLIHLGDIKGRKKAVQYFLDIPNILIGILEQQKEEENGRHEGRTEPDE